MRSVRIGAGQGFYGDIIEPAIELAERGEVQYICCDCLAELTLAILHKDRRRDPALGYTRDVEGTLRALLPYVRQKGIRLVTNAGGLNPERARDAAARIARQLGISGLRVAVAVGDDLLGRLDELQAAGADLAHQETGEPLAGIGERLVFANAYLGAQPIAAALRAGADVVITGRTTDTAQFLGPCLAEFEWAADDRDRLAQGVLLGHLLECSGQASGGNFGGDWWNVPDLDRIGYPIAEIWPDGRFLVTKAPGSGGRVSVETVQEQLLYEIHDPAAYVTPDVTADFSRVTLAAAGQDRVEVLGARGRPAPPTLKVILGYRDGYMGSGIVGFSWPDALAKAREAARILKRQIERFGIEVEEVWTEFLGVNALHGPLASPNEPDAVNEVFLRLAARTRRYEDAARIGRLFPPLVLNGPPGVAMMPFAGQVRELLGLWSTLVRRDLIEPHVRVSVEQVT